MYGQVLGVSTGGTGAVTLASLPDTGGARTMLLIFGITAVLFGALMVTLSTISMIRERLAKNQA
jgi:hypothetical protein